MIAQKSRQTSHQPSSTQSIEQIVLRSVNPFDPSTFKPGNFWQEDYQEALEVNSIHQDVVEEVEANVRQVERDRVTRTLLLQGASGAGKSHLLGRLKTHLNDQAFFVYIGPWPDSRHIWRHVLRNTVDSLVQTPKGQTESQLLQWLNRVIGLQQSQKKPAWVAKGRKGFVNNMKAANPIGLYNSSEFFGVLYSLTDPELYGIACDWLRGDDLDEDALKQLKVKQSIDSEQLAQKVLSNIGRIAKSTLPIVLCFDQLDNIPKLQNGKPDFQALMNVNTTIHNEKLMNFLVLISVITSTWRKASQAIQPADAARIGQRLTLKNISLDQAEAIWASRLYPLYSFAQPTPQSQIAPLSRDFLQAKFPGGKTLPRTALMVGQQLIDHFKRHRQLPDLQREEASPNPKPAVEKVDLAAAFRLVWDKEYRAARERVRTLKQFSSPELMQRLREALEALERPPTTTSFFSTSKYAANAMSFRQASAVGVLWAEEANMSTFCSLMKHCKKESQRQEVQAIALIRSASTGKPQSKGHKLYQELFSQQPNSHLTPDLHSLYYLETYHQLVNSVCSRELVVGQETISLQQLQSLVRESNLLEACPLLRQLVGLASGQASSVSSERGTSGASVSQPTSASPVPDPMEDVEQHVRSLILTQPVIGRETLFQNAKEQFSGMTDHQFEQLLQSIFESQTARIIDPNAPLDQQLICLIPA